MFCGNDDGTIVAAHSNQSRHGKGLGLKAHDCFVAFLCAHCHHWLDQGLAGYYDKCAMFDAAWTATLPHIERFFDDVARRLIEEVRKQQQ
jgi:hypothetical protein